MTAANISAASENKIHDNESARRLGFEGALVPGVAVYAYMSELPIRLWGRRWLERGCAECRFRRPVYHGTTLEVTGIKDGASLLISADAGKVQCASGGAWIASDERGGPALGVIPDRRPPAERPPASEATLAPGVTLGIAPFVIDEAALAAYLDAINETLPIYRAEGVVHPGQILQLANRALLENVVLGPWLHLRSTVRNRALAHIGERLSLRARITSNEVVKGNATVRFDALAIANGTTLIAEISHEAIWRPRPKEL